MIIGIVICIVIIVLASFVLYKLNRTCSCVGKPCGSKDDCGNTCCGEKEKCVAGLCCSTDCTGKNCSETNGCGDSCNFCKGVEKCINGNCQRNLCSEFNCDDNCTCPSGKICYQNRCCEPQDCSTGVCGGTGSCGRPACACNDRYCGTGQLNTGACCNAGMCTYDDICNSPAGPTLAIGWGKFCARDSVTNQPECKNCRLTNAIFDDNSLVPISGTITCDSCKGGNSTVVVKIDKNIGAYIADGKGGIIGQANTCPDNCGSCACVFDDDCKHMGCGTCVGGSCVK
jgi:hypothetical protein